MLTSGLIYLLLTFGLRGTGTFTETTMHVSISLISATVASYIIAGIFIFFFTPGNLADLTNDLLAVIPYIAGVVAAIGLLVMLVAQSRMLAIGNELNIAIVIPIVLVIEAALGIAYYFMLLNVPTLML